jgi:hypothetical protein
MNFKQALSGTVSRILRFIGIVAVLYISMVFYLALTERRNAYPRAISHNEARAAIQETAKSAECTLEDGTILNGWIVGNNDVPALLYYPGADEDAAQFLAEMGTTDELRLIAFNYRGGADNKGTPSKKPSNPMQKPSPNVRRSWREALCNTLLGAEPAPSLPQNNSATTNH